jgi:hypothetical protein
MPKKGKLGKGAKKGRKKSIAVPEAPIPEAFGPFGDQCKVLTPDELIAAAKKGKKGKKGKKKKSVAPPVIEWAARLQVNRHGVGAQILVPNGASDQSIDLLMSCREFDPLVDKQVDQPRTTLRIPCQV